MPTDTEVEERLRQLEAEVKAKQPARVVEIPNARPTANIAPRAQPAYAPSRADAKKPISWKTKLVVGAALVVGGLIAVSLVWKVVKLAFYGAALVAILGGGYWLWRKYLKKK